MKFLLPVLTISLLSFPAFSDETNKEENDDALYSMNFEEEDEGFYPLDFLVLEGDFQVKAQDDNKLLVLPGTPLRTMGFLYGPTITENVMVSGEFFSERVNRRFPRFGIGLCGVMGYKLRINPAKRALELYLGDDVVAQAPYKWSSGKWSTIQLAIVKDSDSQWTVKGKAWNHGDEVPETWTIEHVTSDEPINGRPTAWGTPYSERDILFDNLSVEEWSEE